MASLAQFRKKFKDNYFAKIKFISEYLSTKDIMNAIIQADHRWRDRIWNPAGTFWTFMLQVLHAGSSCRDAVAMFLAE